MKWGKYLVAMAVVVVGLVVVGEVAPKAVLPLVLAIILGVALTHPSFLREWVALMEFTKRQAGG